MSEIKIVRDTCLEDYLNIRLQELEQENQKLKNRIDSIMNEGRDAIVSDKTDVHNKQEMTTLEHFWYSSGEESARKIIDGLKEESDSRYFENKQLKEENARLLTGMGNVANDRNKTIADMNKKIIEMRELVKEAIEYLPRSNVEINCDCKCPTCMWLEKARQAIGGQ